MIVYNPAAAILAAILYVAALYALVRWMTGRHPERSECDGLAADQDLKDAKHATLNAATRGEDHV